MPRSKKKGFLEVICGSMFSGKSEELIRRLRRSQFAKRNVIVFKHALDTRESQNHVRSHNGTLLKAIPANSIQTIENQITAEIQVVGIDEVQFFSQNIVPLICQLIEQGKHVIVAGLDLDFRGMPFGCMPVLMAIADCVIKLKAICMECGNEAQLTQRLVNGKPAHWHDPLIVVGAQEQYQAKCRDCHFIDNKPVFLYDEK